MIKSILQFIKDIRLPKRWIANENGQIDYKRLKCLCIINGIYIILGICLNQLCQFPYLLAFSLIFYLLGSFILYFIFFFHVKISKIATLLLNKNRHFKEVTVYYSLSTNPRGYFAIPALAITVVFGVGGCVMYTNLILSLTFVWVMILFCIVVYISIVGYMHYMFLFYFIYSLSRRPILLDTPEKRITNYSPAKLELIEELTALYETYRLVFFLSGSLYCIAFAAFCWIPDFGADRCHPFFFLLWGIIFIAIVVVFPLSALLEYHWIRKIIHQLKNKYMEDLSRESDILFGKVPMQKLSLLAKTYYETRYAELISNSLDYSTTSHLNAVLSMVATLFNAAITIVSNAETIMTLITYFHQMP